MAISKKSLYGISALYYLSKHPNQPISIKEISNNCSIPKKFLEQILLELKNANIIKSIRGNKGGYIIEKPSNQVKIIDILNVIDKDFCVNLTSINDTTIKNVFTHIQKNINAMLSLTLEEFQSFDEENMNSYTYTI